MKVGVFQKYVLYGVAAAYALHGGCDPNVREIFQPKYAEEIISTRKAVEDLIDTKGAAAFRAMSEEGSQQGEVLETMVEVKEND